jgi:hypothetical protein
MNNSEQQTSIDLFRLSKSKAVVDISSNTIRGYNREGLRFYKVGRAVFVSKSELDQFIRSKAVCPI